MHVLPGECTLSLIYMQETRYYDIAFTLSIEIGVLQQLKLLQGLGTVRIDAFGESF